MFEILLIIPLSIFYFLMICHSISSNGEKGTLIFFGYALLFSFIRELIIGIFAPLYEGSGNLKIGNVSLIIVLGWVFSFYLANYFSTHLIKETRFENSLILRAALGMFFVTSISMVMETSAIYLEWWSWRPSVLPYITPENSLFGAPIFVFIGWSITGFVFLITYYILTEKDVNYKSISIILILISLMLLNFVIGNLFILQPPGDLVNSIYSIVVQTIIVLILNFYYKTIEKHIFLSIGLFIVTIWLIMALISPIIYTIYGLIGNYYYLIHLFLLIMSFSIQIYLIRDLIMILKSDFDKLERSVHHSLS